jgi:uroporphyrinogen decarboxylase
LTWTPATHSLAVVPSPATTSRRRFVANAAASAAALTLGGRLGFAGARRPAMSHRERIERALALEPTDRVPFGFWWHFPNRDRSPRRLAELQLALQRRLDLDFIKFSPYGLYSVVDWGVRLDVRGGDQTPIPAEYPIHRPEDWRKLRPFRGDEGEYLVVLEAQRIALQELTEDVPLVQTVFSPLTSCAKLAGRETLVRHLREAPGAVHAGLEVVTETTRRFAREVVSRGAAGLFFASQLAGEGILTRAEYREFAGPYDTAVLEAVRDRSWFNIFHLHGENVMFDQVLDAPVHAFNYHDREGGGPSLAELRRMTRRGLVGGLGRKTTLVRGTPEQIDAEVRDAWDQVGRRGLVLGPGCVVGLDTPEENLRQLRRSVTATAEL